ncbi:MAG TPA: hypothetical protein VFS43_36585 [Polyangiaceae bacterium]|nr:hypothetical protein [Polyangiaceae bacterium]
MTIEKSVLVVGLQPELVELSGLEFGSMSDLSAEAVRSGLEAERQRLNDLGYDAHLCLTDLGETAEAVVAERLAQKRFACVVIGAGVRTIPKYFLLFEKLINVVHERAPQAKICFNTNPNDTAAAVQRWL